MRNLFVIVLGFIILLSPQSVKSQVVGFDATVSEYGQLETVLGDNWDKIDSLSVTGPINAVDFKTMWKCAFYGTLNVLNLENAQVENNKIPDFALYDSDKQYWETDETIYLDIHRVILPDNIVEIGIASFHRMMLRKINLPESLAKFNIYSFANCHWLNVDPLIIPEGITEIPEQCFVNCQSFKKLVLPSTLRVIKDLAFYNTRMEEVTFPDGLEILGEASFHGSGELRKAILPNSCQELGEFVFSMCDSLKELRLPEGIKRIPTNFASYCYTLEKVEIPESVEEIGYNAFVSALELWDMKFPAGLKRIQANAFSCCNPDSVVFPKTIEFIGDGSCCNWGDVRKIYSMSAIPPYCDGKVFDGTNDAPVYVPVGSADLYRNAQGWSHFTKFIETDEFPQTGIYGMKEVAQPDAKVYWAGGSLNIEVDNGREQPISYWICDMDGRIVNQGYLNSSSVSVSLPRGIYIVRVGNSVQKIG